MSNPIPALWREELYHPLIVHFPIAFFVLATALSAILLLIPSKSYSKTVLKPCRILLLSLGVLFGWLAIWTGQLAEDIVNRIICDPTVTHNHEWYAEWSIYVFSGVLLFELILNKFLGNGKLTLLALLSSLTTFIACYFLVRAGHLGFSLVYQQGAGVYHPSESCTEFE